MTDETPGAQTQAAKAAARKRAPAKRTNRRVTTTLTKSGANDTKVVDAPEEVEVTGAPEPQVNPWQPRPVVPTVDELWSNVMESVRSIAKGDYNEDQQFRFRGVDSVVDAVGPALREHQVKVIPKRILEHHAEYYETRRGTRMVNRTVRVEWEVRGPQGDSFTGESMGEAADAGDKSMSKAQSVAYRVFLLEALNVPTGEPDPDGESHERANGPQEPPQRQEQRTYASRDEARQAQAGEENQAAAPDNAEARGQMWVKAKKLGWEWKNLAQRFQSDYGMTTEMADAATLNAFTTLLVSEAAAEEAQAQKNAAEVLGAKPIGDAAPTGGVL